MVQSSHPHSRRASAISASASSARSASTTSSEIPQPIRGVWVHGGTHSMVSNSGSGSGSTGQRQRDRSASATSSGRRRRVIGVPRFSKKYLWFAQRRRERGGVEAGAEGGDVGLDVEEGEGDPGEGERMEEWMEGERGESHMSASPNEGSGSGSRRDRSGSSRMIDRDRAREDHTQALPQVWNGISRSE